MRRKTNNVCISCCVRALGYEEATGYSVRYHGLRDFFVDSLGVSDSLPGPESLSPGSSTWVLMYYIYTYIYVYI